MYTSPYAYPNPYQNINSHMMPSQQVIKVNGRNGAEAYQMSPNSSVLLLDESAPVYGCGCHQQQCPSDS